jgi:hypothetical protein
MPKNRLLLIGPEERAAIQLAIEEARLKPIPLEYVRRGISGGSSWLTLEQRKEVPPRPVDAVPLELPLGYSVAVSFEEQPVGLCMHLSVSVDTAPQGMVPDRHAIAMIIDAFGLKDRPNHIWLEEFAPGQYAINIVATTEISTDD